MQLAPYPRLGKYFILLSFFLFLCGCNRVKIIVPDGYIGNVCLIKSNVTTDRLVLDSNGIGYITESTFETLRLQPIVQNVSGRDLSANCVGYNSFAFWAKGEFKSLDPKIKIEYLGFEIVSDHLKNKKQYHDTDLLKVVDTTKLKKE